MSSPSGLYRPPQWSGPAMVSVTQAPSQGPNNFGPTAVPMTPGSYIPGALVPATGPAAGTQYVYGASGSAQTTYVFDAVLDLEHEQRLEKTSHPVQTGAAISSHAYLMPPRVVMLIGMSDAMDAYSNGVNNANSPAGATPGTVTPFSGSSSSKSVNAYQTMISLQAARQPLTVTTRLRTYTNMVITSVSPREDYKTITGLRMRVEFEQIFTALTASASIAGGLSEGGTLTARPDATQQTGLGAVNASAVARTVQNQFQYPPPAVPGNPTGVTAPGDSFVQIPFLGPVQVPGAGSYSSLPGQQALP
jgi:hypothetical protein